VNVSEKGIAVGMTPQLPGVKYIPGIMALLAVGLAGKWVSGFVPHFEYVIFAILIGMAVSNTVGIPRALAPGIDTYELWLKVGIVLMGSRLALQSIFAIGGLGLVLVTVEILVSIFVARRLAGVFGLSEKLGDLIGIGVGICGVSAIIGATGAIDAEEEDATYAIATILIFGAIMVFLYPLIGHMLHLSDQFFGFWAGLAVDNTAETIATGFAFSEKAGEVATVVKLTRNALMGIVILIFALIYAKRGMTGEVENKARFLWQRFPKFLIGFLLMSLLATTGFLGKADVTAMKHLSNWAFLLAFAGVGFKANFSRMKAGLKPFFVGLGVETVVAVITFAMLTAVM